MAWLGGIVVASAILLGTVASVVAGTSHDLSSLEEGLHRRGDPTIRTSISPAPFLRGAHGDASALIIATEVALNHADRRAVQAFVEHGGTAIGLNSIPASELSATDPALDAVALPGRLYGEAGGDSALEGGERVTDELRAWSTGIGFSPVLNTTGRSFRDTNANGVLDAGEPVGPFAIAVQANVGAGQMILVGVRGGDVLSDLLAGFVLERLPGGTIVILTSPEGVPGDWAHAWLLPLYLIPVSFLGGAAAVIVACASLTLIIPGAGASTPRRDVAAQVTRLLERLGEASTPTGPARAPAEEGRP